ncbi:MAG: helix-turn-helix domain-containing protein [Bryobacteraceae bacterium]|jgi:transposase-like protein
MKNRVFSAKFKAAAVRRMQAGESPSALARALNLRRKLLYEWRDKVAAGKPLRTAGRPKTQPESEAVVHDDGQRVRELEQLVGQLTVEVMGNGDSRICVIFFVRERLPF